MTDKPTRWGKQTPTPTAAEPEQFEEGTFSDPKVRAKWEVGGKYYRYRHDAIEPRTPEEIEASTQELLKEMGYGGSE